MLDLPSMTDHRDKADRPVDRRRFLQLMAAAMALAGLEGCGPDDPPDPLVPYVMQPGTEPERARWYAGAVLERGLATGALLLHRMGRPVKVEGNPDHPASLGASDARMQAAILDLYDPDRSRTPLQDGRIPATADAAIAALLGRLEELRPRSGEGLRILTGAITSPVLAARIEALRKTYPALRWHRWEAECPDNARGAAQLAFGTLRDTIPDLAAAEIVLAIESDLLDAAPGHLAHARAFAARRRGAEEGRGPISRVYAIESTPTLIGARADHRFALPPVGIDSVLRALAARLGVAPAGWLDGAPPWLAPLADDLAAHRGAALLHAGAAQPVAVQALVHLVNHALGAPGRTLHHIAPVEVDPVGHAASLAELVQDMAAGRVDTLLLLGTNPVFTAPADLGFAEALARVPLSLHLGVEADETARACRWHLPEAHLFERWADARAFDGTATVIQPQIRPLYGGWSAETLLARLAGETGADDRARLRDLWLAEADRHGAADREAWWLEAVRSGVVPGSASPEAPVTPAADLPVRLPPRPRERGLVLLLRPDPWLRDGRHANNAWLQELPRPLTRLTWGNAVLMAPATAGAHGLQEGDLVELAAAGRSVRAPVALESAQAPGCVTLAFGFGRRATGGVGAGAGHDAYPLRRRDALWLVEDPGLRATGQREPLARTQHALDMAGEDLVRVTALAAFNAGPQPQAAAAAQPSLYPPPHRPGHGWAMAINLNSCIGCGACVAACQAENNIPVVGREEVLRGRAMHWIRVDRYDTAAGDDAGILFQPVPCMHCEQAPCEVVCPVEATLHDSDGLNLMVYNRCVGTRFCSNNCPYKVRRFNFFDYSGDDRRLPPSWNPEVSVRGRGVMEKCTYCIQRIREAEIAGLREGRPLREGEVTTACQQACPAEAIVFGDQNHPDSAVARRKASPLDYALLDHLGTRPRTTYQGRLANPNPALAKG
jgi:molybdopterin-containing oxidoreductase family iron-sulfur binding subunit